MFTSKQTRLMNTLGIVSDTERSETYDAYCEVSSELSAEGVNPGTFTEYLERKVQIAAYLAKRNNEKALTKI